MIPSHSSSDITTKNADCHSVAIMQYYDRLIDSSKSDVQIDCELNFCQQMLCCIMLYVFSRIDESNFLINDQYPERPFDGDSDETVYIDERDQRVQWAPPLLYARCFT